MTTEKALREALQKVMDYPEIRSYMGSILANYADAALSLPETQGEPVATVTDAPDPAPKSVDEPEQIIGNDGKAFPLTFDAQAWAKAFNETLTVLGHPQHDEGWLIGWFANAIMRGFDEANWRAAHPSQLAQGEEIGEMRITGVHWYGQNPHAFPLGTKFFAAAPAAPTQDGTPLVCLRHGFADSTPPCWQWCGSDRCVPAKPTNGEGA